MQVKLDKKYEMIAQDNFMKNSIMVLSIIVMSVSLTPLAIAVTISSSPEIQQVADNPAYIGYVDSVGYIYNDKGVLIGQLQDKKIFKNENGDIVGTLENEKFITDTKGKYIGVLAHGKFIQIDPAEMNNKFVQMLSKK